MGNSNTEHSRQLRAKTASKRNADIINDGGHLLRTLLEEEEHKMLKCLIEWHNIRGHTSQRAVVIAMIRAAYSKLPASAKLGYVDDLDQIDLFEPKNSAT